MQYKKSFVVSLHIDDFTFIAHAQKRQLERLLQPEKCKRDSGTIRGESLFRSSSIDSLDRGLQTNYAKSHNALLMQTD